MAFKIVNILTSWLCILVSLSCYAQDGTEEMPVKRIRKASWSLLRITIPPYTEATDEEKKGPRCPPAFEHSSASEQELLLWPNTPKSASPRLTSWARKTHLITSHKN